MSFDSIMQKGHGEFALPHHHTIRILLYCSHLFLELLERRLFDHTGICWNTVDDDECECAPVNLDIQSLNIFITPCLTDSQFFLSLTDELYQGYSNLLIKRFTYELEGSFFPHLPLKQYIWANVILLNLPNSSNWHSYIWQNALQIDYIIINMTRSW